jgi:hypothetical protein
LINLKNRETGEYFFEYLFDCLNLDEMQSIVTSQIMGLPDLMEIPAEGG